MNRLGASINLDNYIQIETVKNKRGLVLFRFVRFNLDKTSINKILRAKATGQDLWVSKNLLAQFRYCALSDGENRYGRNRFPSGLTFCTDYRIKNKTSVKELDNMVMRSVISLDGDIIHQIQRDCLEHPKRCLAIATSHYWLIEQLLNQLRAKTHLWLNRFSWGLSLLVVAATGIRYIENLIPINFWTLFTPLVISWLLQQSIKRLLVYLQPLLNRWVWHQLLLYFLSPKPLEKKIAKGMLRRLVP